MTKCKHGLKAKICTKCNSKCQKIKLNQLLPGYEELKATNDIKERFYLYLDSASKAKNYGRSSDQTITNNALNVLGSILNPNFEYFAFITVGIIIPASTVAQVEALYGLFANIAFNAFSQHYATNVRVQLVPNTCPRKAIMTAGGGEWASIIADNTTIPITTAEQQTISNWCLEWIEIKGKWYINIYLEYGDRIFRFYPGNNATLPVPGAYTLYFQRLYPNALLENTIPPGQNYPASPVPPNITLPCAMNQSLTAQNTTIAGEEKIVKITNNKEEWTPKLLKAYGIKN